MRVRLLEDIPGIGLKDEQVGLNDSKAMELITERRAIDVESCVPNAKEGLVAIPIWQAQDAAAAAEQESTEEEAADTEDTENTRRTAHKK